MTEETIQEVLSTQITETPQAGGTGGGTPSFGSEAEEQKGDEGLSVADVIRREANASAEAEKAASREEKTDPVAEEKPEPEAAKTEAKKDAGGEPATQKEVEAETPDEAGETEAAKAAQSEGKADKIPSRLLPKEREVWANVPNAVKAAWERMEREHSEVSQKYEPAVKFHEELREYDAMAKQTGTSVKDALSRYVEMDKLIAKDFGQGLAQIANAHGRNPTEAVAQFMRAAGVSPQQLGAYLQGKPAQPQQAQQRPQVDPVAQRAMQEVQQLRAQMQQQTEAHRQQAEASRVEQEVIAPFAAQHTRFEELGEDIAFFLQSGRIPSSLSPVERLEVAYDMAERINPAPVVPSPSLAEPAGKPASDAGKKSVRGAPATGKSLDTDLEEDADLVTLLRREARKLTA